MPFTSSNTALAATFAGTAVDCDVIEVTADVTLPANLCHQTYINITGTAYNLIGTWIDGAAFKTLDPGESVTLTRASTGAVYIDAQYKNIKSPNKIIIQQ